MTTLLLAKRTIQIHDNGSMLSCCYSMPHAALSGEFLARDNCVVKRIRTNTPDAVVADVVTMIVTVVVLVLLTSNLLTMAMLNAYVVVGVMRGWLSWWQQTIYCDHTYQIPYA